jgi:negative regulator of flagellin synthesis FlgM
MKISDNSKPYSSGIQARLPRDIEKSAPTSDNGRVSSPPDELKVRPNAGATSLTFDTQKVNQIKAAIANGTFKVNSDRVAEGLIESVRSSLTDQGTKNPS